MFRDPARKCFCGCGKKIPPDQRDLNRLGNEFRGQTWEMATLTVNAADDFRLAFQHHPKWSTFYMTGHQLQEGIEAAVHNGREITPEFYEKLVAWYWAARPRNVALKRILKESNNGQTASLLSASDALDGLWNELEEWIADDQTRHPRPDIIPIT